MARNSLVAVCLLLLIASPPAVADSPAGVVDRVEAGAWGMLPAVGRRALGAGDALQAGQAVQTEATGAIALTLVGGTRVALLGDGHLLLGVQGNGGGSLGLQAGTTRIAFNRGAPVTIVTPSAVIGIAVPGSVVVVRVEPFGTTILSVVSGVATMTTAGAGAGFGTGAVALPTGYSATARPGSQAVDVVQGLAGFALEEPTILAASGAEPEPAGEALPAAGQDTAVARTPLVPVVDHSPAPPVPEWSAAPVAVADDAPVPAEASAPTEPAPPAPAEESVPGEIAVAEGAAEQPEPAETILPADSRDTAPQDAAPATLAVLAPEDVPPVPPLSPLSSAAAPAPEQPAVALPVADMVEVGLPTEDQAGSPGDDESAILFAAADPGGNQGPAFGDGGLAGGDSGDRGMARGAVRSAAEGPSAEGPSGESAAPSAGSAEAGDADGSGGGALGAVGKAVGRAAAMGGAEIGIGRSRGESGGNSAGAGRKN